jgi:hypothetical protein|tara:strand:+ start:173 stop:1252 length:1080 start_codon:yes stop_codon:yes gene_type:complete
MPSLLTNGCSITLGAELGETTKQGKNDGDQEWQHCDFQYRHDHRWPTILAKKLELSPVNLSRGGGSNWRTWRTTQDFLLETDKIVNCAVIQMTEASRFQIPIGFDFIDKWRPTEPTPDFHNWADGGIWSAESDVGYFTQEEYCNWNWGEYQVMVENIHGTPAYSFQNDNDKNVTGHYHNMKDEFSALTFMNQTVHSLFDYLRHVIYLHDMFESNEIPHLIVDMMMNWETCQSLKSELEMIDAFGTEVLSNTPPRGCNWRTKWAHFDTFGDPEKDKTNKIFIRTMQKSEMSRKFNNLFKTVSTAKWFDGHPYAMYFRDAPYNNQPNGLYIGNMPDGHPDEACHQAYADRIYNELKGRKIL